MDEQPKIDIDYGKPCPVCTVNCEVEPPVLFPNDKCRECGYIDKRPRESGVHK